MNLPKSASITNYGVFNTGDIHGDVVNTINQSFAQNPDDRLAELQKALVGLAGEIQKHSEQVEKPQEALRRVQQAAEEVTGGSADKGVVLSYLDRVLAMGSRIPSIVQAVSGVKTLVGMLFGMA